MELGIILPFLLAFVGGAADLARGYQAWMTIESATRNAAEYVAGHSTAATAEEDARRIVCLESQYAPGFVPGTGSDPTENCTVPTVTVTFSSTTTGAGTPTNPLGTATVRVELPFDTMLPYPLLPSGGWTLAAETTFGVIQGK